MKNDRTKRIEIIIKDYTGSELVNEDLGFHQISYDIKNNIRISPLIDLIKKDFEDARGGMISYFSDKNQEFVYIGNDPLPIETSVSPSILCVVEDMIRIRIRPKSSNSLGTFFSGNTGTGTAISKGSRRTKERKIGDVINKVSSWRALYNGIQKEGQMQKLSLDDAAREVKISKKSLDDYLL